MLEKPEKKNPPAIHHTLHSLFLNSPFKEPKFKHCKTVLPPADPVSPTYFESSEKSKLYYYS